MSRSIARPPPRPTARTRRFVHDARADRRFRRVELASRAAGLAQIRFALGGIVLQRLMKDLLNLLPSFHCRASQRRSVRGAAMRGRISNPG